MSGNEDFRIGQVGDNFQVFGTNNIGKIGTQNNAPQDPQAALQDLIGLIEVLRGRVQEDDRAVLDASLDTLTEDGVERGAFRRALGSVSGVAQLVGEIGLPVAEAVRRVMALFGT
ncbi:hypothetical protein K7B10_14730 [Streptomyces flavotricini]|uniref:Uncharacterized protein n=1 Tax=Streptomyces flavotricini TaxID=66888 RepID=A0ABS8E4W2_9ACTN|nr:hypothetical protein [Streptomyces flavotricini]MCC0096015.1 hypothetical protein [Streptomyces flavotricini]